jgi:ComF family protein
MFRQLLSGLSGRLPSQCAVCHAWPAHPMCDDRVQRFGQPVPRCQTCALPALDQALAAVPYAYPWSGLMAQFKFHQHTGWARSLAMLMRNTPWVEPALESADCLLPMPLSPLRLQERGFNQALLLARALDPAKVRPDLLLRIKETAPQSTLARMERLLRVRGAYAVEPLHAGELHNTRIVLVDDVMTTGASLRAAAEVLRHHGASHFTALIFARTE